jgi:hypothetical protein
MKAFTGATRLSLLGFFGSHIIFTLLLDSQGTLSCHFVGALQHFLTFFCSVTTPPSAQTAVLPLSIFPQFLLDLSEFEVAYFNDPLMGNARNLLWFQSMVVLELFFQLPFFVAALYYIRNNVEHSYPEGFRRACIAYGAHTSTTLIPILSTFWVPEHEATTTERITITALYFPYLAIPAWLLWYAATSGDAKTKSS